MLIYKALICILKQ